MMRLYFVFIYFLSHANYLRSHSHGPNQFGEWRFMGVGGWALRSLLIVTVLAGWFGQWANDSRTVGYQMTRGVKICRPECCPLDCNASQVRPL
jgi:hypothetical protein